MTIDEVDEATGFNVAPTSLRDELWSFVPREVQRLIDRLSVDSVPLVDHCGAAIGRGVVSGLTKAFVIDPTTRNMLIRGNKESRKLLKPYLIGRDIRRYQIAPLEERYLIYTHHGIDMTPYPAVLKHLTPFRKPLEARATHQPWYELQQPQFRFVPFFDGPKIIFPDIAPEPRFAIDEAGHYSGNTTYFIPSGDRFLLGLLNSSLAGFYFRQNCAALEGSGESYLRFFGQTMEQFPVKTGHKVQHVVTAIRDHAQSIEALHARSSAFRTDLEKVVHERQVVSLDQQIDRLVYELYGLTDAEIAIVERRGERQ